MSSTQSQSRQRFTVSVPPEDSLVIAYLHARANNEGETISQTGIVRKILLTSIEKIRRQIEDELARFKASAETTEEVVEDE